MEEDTTTGSTELKAGKVIANRWKIVEKLGAGEMGIVYRDLTRPDSFAALKMESSNVEGGGVLKIEVEVLKKLQDRPNTIRLYPASRRAEFSQCLAGPFIFEEMELPTTTESSKIGCMERNAVALWDICTHSGQEHPCFTPNKFVKMNVQDISEVAILASQLCVGRVPSAYLRKSMCCFTPKCLQKCYGSNSAFV